MELVAIKTKQLTQIESLTKHLLIALSSSNIGTDTTIYQELSVLAIETINERKLRNKNDQDKQVEETNNGLNNWDNEGGSVLL